jgi:TM2 domain-containing membrane protein YozV
MRGQVLGVDTRTGDGVVTGDDGRRYRFRPEDWAPQGEPAIGLYVDFETNGERALSLLPVPGAPQPVMMAASRPEPVNDRNRLVAALLAFFLGTLGLHRFYTGRTGSAIAMLVLSCTLIGLLVTGPWALIDTIRYLFMSDREFAHRYARLR